MAVLLVTYNLKLSGPNNMKLITAIEKFDHTKLTESSYAIATSDSPKRILDVLRPLVDENDLLFVLTLALPAAGHGDAGKIHWLEGNMR